MGEMTNLKDINFGINQYCGPAVLSALTGESTDRCAAVISSISGKREIKAVDRNHLKLALEKLRFTAEETNFSGSTLYGTLFRMHNHDGLYIVHVPHHVVAVEIKGTEIYICDNHCKTPLDIKQSARLMQKVEKVLRVSRRSEPKFLRQELKVTKFGYRYDISRFNIYENEEDNTVGHVGSITASSKTELDLIVEALRIHND
jgi:hypothetical protein